MASIDCNAPLFSHTVLSTPGMESQSSKCLSLSDLRDAEQGLFPRCIMIGMSFAVNYSDTVFSFRCLWSPNGLPAC